MKLKYTLQVCTNYSYGTLFLKHWGQIAVEVTGKQRNNDIELEFPASYTFYYKKPLKIQRLNSTYRTNKRQRG